MILDKYFSSSLIYYDDDLTWCVNRVEPLSFPSKLWYVATKLAWIMSFLLVCVNSVAILFLLRLVNDKNGFLKYDLDFLSQNSPSPRISGNGMRGRNSTTRNVSVVVVSAVFLVLSVAWNFMILKVIFQPIPGYQIQTVNELIAHGFRLSGGTFANMSIWENAQVNRPKAGKIKISKILNF